MLWILEWAFKLVFNVEKGRFVNVDNVMLLRNEKIADGADVI